MNNAQRSSWMAVALVLATATAEARPIVINAEPVVDATADHVITPLDDDVDESGQAPDQEPVSRRVDTIPAYAVPEAGPRHVDSQPGPEVITCGGPPVTDDHRFRQLVGFRFHGGTLFDPNSSLFGLGLLYGRNFGRWALIGEYAFAVAHQLEPESGQAGGVLHRASVSARLDALRLGPARAGRPIRLFVEAGLGRHYFDTRAGDSHAGNDVTLGGGMRIQAGRSGRAWMSSLGARVMLGRDGTPPVACRGACALTDGESIGVTGLLVYWSATWGR